MKARFARIGPNIKKIFLMFVPSLITAGIVLSFVIYFGIGPSRSQIAQTSAQQAVTTPDPIEIIKNVSEKAIQISSDTVEIMKWVVVTFLGLVISIIGVFWRTEREIAQKIAQIQQNYNLVSETLFKTQSQLSDLSGRYLNLQQDLHALPSRILPFEMAVAAYEAGKITEETFLESQAWYSWQKWIFGDDSTGYEELVEHKESREGLPGSIIRTAITVLAELVEKKKIPGVFNSRDQETMFKLFLLLNLESQL